MGYHIHFRKLYISENWQLPCETLFFSCLGSSSFDGPLSDRKRQQGVRARISSFQMPAGIRLISILDIRPPTKPKNMPALQPKRLLLEGDIPSTVGCGAPIFLRIIETAKLCFQLTQFSINFPIRAMQFFPPKSNVLSST